MRLAAFDLSLTATGYAIWPGGKDIDFGTIRPPLKMIGCQRLDYIRREVCDLARGADLVLLEGLSFGSNDPSAQERAGLAWAVRLKLWAAEIPVIAIAPTTNKKWATGKGNSEKNLVLREVYRRFNVEAGNDNEADAASILFLGRALVGDWKCQIDAQREALETVRKANETELERLMERLIAEVGR